MNTHFARLARLAPLLVAAGLAAGAAGIASAQNAAVTASGATATDRQAMASKALSNDDREFLLKATGGGLFEIEASKMAAKMSRNPEIRRLAAMLVKDHMAANEELKAIAQSLPLRLPRNMPDGEKAMLDTLSKASPAEFDERYLKVVGLEHHRTDIAMFEERAEKAEHPKVKAFAAKILPKLRAHLAAAEKISLPGANTAAASAK